MINNLMKVSYLKKRVDLRKNRMRMKYRVVKILREKRMMRVNNKTKNNRTNSKKRIKVHLNNKHSKLNKIDNPYIYSFQIYSHSFITNNRSYQSEKSNRHIHSCIFTNSLYLAHYQYNSMS